MKIRKLTIALLVASHPITTAANAQKVPADTDAIATPATPAVGTTVYDASGAEVGKIKSITGTNFVIDTGTHSATLALTTLGSGPKGPVLGITKIELNAAAAKASAAAKAETVAAIIADAPVFASDGTTQLGKISEVTDTEFVLDAGTVRVKLPKTAVAKGASGLMIGMTAQAFADATKSADKSANAAAAKPAGK